MTDVFNINYSNVFGGEKATRPNRMLRAAQKQESLALPDNYREIPLIVNPYEEIELLSIASSDLFKTTKINLNPNILEPKVRNIVGDNYDGSITVLAYYANKIQ